MKIYPKSFIFINIFNLIYFLSKSDQILDFPGKESENILGHNKNSSLSKKKPIHEKSGERLKLFEINHYFNNLNSPKSPIKQHANQASPSPYNSIWAINILKNHYNIEMGQEKMMESEPKISISKWKIRKIRNVKPFFNKKKVSVKKRNDLGDIKENSREDNFNSVYLDEYQFPKFSKDILQEMNHDMFFKTLGNFKNTVKFVKIK